MTLPSCAPAKPPHVLLAWPRGARPHDPTSVACRAVFRHETTWVGDITYLRTREGWAYIATVIDLGSRRVVGFAVVDHMRSSLVEEAMEMAVLSRRPAAGLIFHSDRGSQYRSAAFRTLLDRHGIRQSLSRPRQCWDNAVAESFFSTLKTELIYRQPMTTLAAARQAVFEYIEVSTTASDCAPPWLPRPNEYERETPCPTTAASAANEMCPWKMG